MNDVYLRRLGNLIATENATRSIAAIVLRLIIGYFAHLPLDAISFNASVAFFLTFAFEFPTGLIADYVGYKKCISMGCYLQAVAVMCIFFAVFAFKNDQSSLMWVLLALEGAFDALGNTLISGAKEALIQGTVDAHTAQMPVEEGKRFRSKYLMLAEAYSRWIPIISTGATVLVTIALEALTYHSEWVLPLVALNWFYLERVYRKVYQLETVAEHSDQGKLRLAFTELWKKFGSDPKTMVGVSFSLTIALIINYFISINLLIMLLRDHFFSGEENGLTETVIVMALILTSKVLRAYILPLLSKSFHSPQILRAASLGLVVAGSAFLLVPGVDLFHRVMMALLILLLDIPVGAMVRTAQMIVLEKVPQSIRATFLSAISTVVFILHTLFAIYFTKTHTGVPNIQEFGTVIIVFAMIGATVSFIFKIN